MINVPLCPYPVCVWTTLSWAPFWGVGFTVVYYRVIRPMRDVLRG